ncbi:MAG: trigger factor [Betaproteobacteria bacterium]|nr:trigger factor [Betaproteobacteria bacterium]
MAVNVETLGTLERRLSMSVPAEEVERQVDERLKKLARNVKLPGFRPGKVPMKIVVQQYGPQVRYEVMSESVQKAFTEAVKEAKLKVAGSPKIEPKEGGDQSAIAFSATFEVYPEFKVGQIEEKTIERPSAEVGDAEVEKTIEILRKQRTTFPPVQRAAQDGDRLVVDFEGRIGGEPFQGGAAKAFAFALGEGRMLPEFEKAARGMTAGATTQFDLTFPADYHGKDVAGKTATFSLTLTEVGEPKLPPLDADFAKALGVADGDLAKMREEVKANVEREVKKRVEARLKSQAMQTLLDTTPLELPKSLVEMETQALLQRASEDLKARGMKMENLPIDPQAFEGNAKRRVALGLIIGELARAEGLQPKPQQVRALIDAESHSYENPAEVVKWFYMQPQRLSEMEGAALESNVVSWVLSKAKVVDKAIPFDELMGSSA